MPPRTFIVGLKVFRLIAAIAALIYFGLSANEVLDRMRFLDRAESAEGKIMEVEIGGDSGEGDGFFYQTEFLDSSGIRHEIQTEVGGTQTFSKGQTVPVLYDPNDPSSGSIDSAWQLWGPAFFWAVFGIVPLLGVAISSLFLWTIGRTAKRLDA